MHLSTSLVIVHNTLLFFLEDKNNCVVVCIPLGISVGERHFESKLVNSKASPGEGPVGVMPLLMQKPYGHKHNFH